MESSKKKKGGWTCSAFAGLQAWMVNVLLGTLSLRIISLCALNELDLKSIDVLLYNHIIFITFKIIINCMHHNASCMHYYASHKYSEIRLLSGIMHRCYPPNLSSSISQSSSTHYSTLCTTCSKY